MTESMHGFLLDFFWARLSFIFIALFFFILYIALCFYYSLKLYIVCMVVYVCGVFVGSRVISWSSVIWYISRPERCVSVQRVIS